MIARRAPHPWRGLARWWSGASLGTARLLLAGLTVLSLLGGMATSAWLLSLVDGRSGAAAVPEDAAAVREDQEPDRPSGTPLGPLSIELPVELGPWTPVSGEAFDPVLSGASVAGFAVEGAWGVLAPGSLVVTVMTVTPGSHRGVDGLTGPFDGPAAVDVPWPGPGKHVAGQHETDGMRELLFAVELADGRLAVLSLSGPTEIFAGGELADSFVTVRPAG